MTPSTSTTLDFFILSAALLLASAFFFVLILVSLFSINHARGAENALHVALDNLSRWLDANKEPSR